MSRLSAFQQSGLRHTLIPLAAVYRGLMQVRNAAYNLGFLKAKRLPAKVISVGNITSGGTGKTPVAIALVRWLSGAGHTCAILSRGYGRKTSVPVLVTDGKTTFADWKSGGDEPAMMAAQLSGVPILVDENRYRGGLELLERFNPEIIILDDAFQRRSLARDLDIVLVNASDTESTHRVLPYGMLREPWSQIERADAVFTTKINLHTPDPFLKSRLGNLTIPQFQIPVEPTFSPTIPDGGRYVMVTGIGDPDSLKKLLEKAQVQIVDEIVFRDHHVYSHDDIQAINTRVKNTSADGIITTEKDWVKLSTSPLSSPVTRVDLEINLPNDAKEFIFTNLFVRSLSETGFIYKK